MLASQAFPGRSETRPVISRTRALHRATFHAQGTPFDFGRGAARTRGERIAGTQVTVSRHENPNESDLQGRPLFQDRPPDKSHSRDCHWQLFFFFDLNDKMCDGKYYLTYVNLTMF